MPKYLLQVNHSLDGVKGVLSKGGSARKAAAHATGGRTRHPVDNRALQCVRARRGARRPLTSPTCARPNERTRATAYALERNLGAACSRLAL